MNFIGRLFGNQTRRSTAESVLTGFIGQAGVMITGVISARILGPEGRGHLALLVLVPSILTLLVGLGIPQALTFELSRGHDGSEYIKTLINRVFLAQAGLIATAHGAIVWFYYAGQERDLMYAAALAVISGPAMLAIQYSVAIYMGLCLFRHVNVFKLAAPAGYAFALVALYFSGGAGLENVVLCWIVPLVAAAMVMLKIARSAIPTATVYAQSPTATVGSLASFGYKGLIGTATPLESFRLDQFAAGLLISPHALGLYAAGQAFGNLSRFIAGSVAQVAYPLVAKRRETQAGIDTVWKFFYVSSAFIAMVTLTLCAITPTLIRVLFGPKFEDAIIIAELLIVGSLFAAIRKVVVESIRGLGHPKISTYAELSMYPWLLTGGLAMTNMYGVLGLALAVAIAHFISMLVGVIASHRALAGNKNISIADGRDWNENQE